MGLKVQAARVSQIVNVVLTYWVISISMVFFNKWLVGGNKKGAKDVDVSIFVAWAQSVVCVVFILIYTRIGAALSDQVKIQTLSFRISSSKPIVLVSFLFSAMLSSNNYCLKFVGVAFFQIARSFTLIFTVIFSVLILRKRASWRVFLCCCLVVLGFFIGIDQEKAAGTLSPIGVLFGLLSSIFVALNGIYTKKALEMELMDSVKLTLHVNANASILLCIPSVLSGQLSAIWQVGKLANPIFWLATSASGILGFLIAWASTRQIDCTSPITHHISNNTKSILQALLAIIIYHDYKSALWWVGCCIVLVGAFLYTIVRMREDRIKTTHNRELVISATPRQESV